ncbi:MAG: hypothetical protein ACKVOW_06605 [Chitinophagaceae bacterium]
MNGALYSYLLQHKSLSIPGLGTIFVERVPAQSDFVNKQLLPSSYHFRFDKYKDSPEREFFSYLAHQKSISDYEAIRWYTEWSENLRNKIKTDGPVTLEKVGVLQLGTTGEIKFEAERPVAIYQAAVPAIRVIRSKSTHRVLVGDRELSNEQASHNLQDETVIERESWWMYALTILAGSLIILFFHFYKNGFGSGAIGNQQTIRVQH